MNTADAIAFLDAQVQDPTLGLPDAVFYYISRMTPLVNVDLLIRDDRGRTLLSWRDDQYSGKGWHVPGGVVRFRETLETRIKKVAESEIGTNNIIFEATPMAINQCIHYERNIRSHFISILYACFLPSTFSPDNKDLSSQDAGYLKWHETCPDDLLGFHEMYRKYM